MVEKEEAIYKVCNRLYFMSNQNLMFLATTREPSYNYTIDKHLQGYYTMQFMSAGGVELSYDDNFALLEGAWFWPAYPGPRLKFHCAAGYTSWFHRHVGFSGDLVFDWIENGLWPIEAQPSGDVARDAEQFDKLIDAARRTDTRGRRLAISLLEQMLIELADARESILSDGAGLASMAPWLKNVIGKLTDGSNESYDDLARNEGMSASTLRRHFRQAMGVSLHQYVINQRVNKARELLVESDLPLKAIADVLGYDNQFFFSRQFREVVGVAPGFFRSSRQISL